MRNKEELIQINLCGKKIRTIRFYKGKLKCEKLISGACKMGKSLYRALEERKIGNRLFKKMELFTAPVRLNWKKLEVKINEG